MRIHSGREQGFTLIELLIVSIVVGVLATLVAMTYSGVQAKNRNNTRQTNIQKLQSELETFYAQQSQYPSLAQLNDAAWRMKNMKELGANIVSDPSWKSTVSACTVAGQPALTVEPTEKCYSYQATATDGSLCIDEKIACGQYTLTAVLEGGEKYVKSSLN
jgi:prepilin-type N-terminal cleavage/methylation domain-containing protein